MCIYSSMPFYHMIRYHIKPPSHCFKTQNYSITTMISIVLPLYSHTCPFPTTIPNFTTSKLRSITVILSFWECYINGIMKCVPFEIGLFHFSMMPLRAVQVAVCIDSLFFFIAKYVPWHECAVICLTHHLLKGIWVVSSLGLLQIKLLWTIMWTMLWTRFLGRHKFSLLCNKCSEMHLLGLGPYGSCMLIFFYFLFF